LSSMYVTECHLTCITLTFSMVVAKKISKITKGGQEGTGER